MQVDPRNAPWMQGTACAVGSAIAALPDHGHRFPGSEVDGRALRVRGQTGGCKTPVAP